MSEYARRRGCTEGAVRRAVRDGRITQIGGMIDPVAADAQWAQNTRVRAGARMPDDRPAGPASQARTGDGGYWASRARREAADADLAELKLAEQRGQLVRVTDVEAEYTKLLVAIRETFMQLPSRVVPLLAAESSVAGMDAVLRAEVASSLRVVAGGAGGGAWVSKSSPRRRRVS